MNSDVFLRKGLVQFEEIKYVRSTNQTNWYLLTKIFLKKPSVVHLNSFGRVLLGVVRMLRFVFENKPRFC